MKGGKDMSNLFSLSAAIVRRINLALMNVANIIISMLTVGVTVEVIMRYALNSPILGVKQISEYAMVWICFLGVGWVLTNKQHVAITLLETYFFGKTKSRKRKLDAFIDLICLFYTISLLWLSSKEIWLEYWEGAVLTGELGGVRAYIPHFCIFLGFLFLSIQLIINIASNFLERDSREGSTDIA